LSELTYITKCRLSAKDGTPCKFTATANPMQTAIIGRPDAHLEEFFQALVQHTAKKHPEAFQLAGMHGQLMLAYLIVGNFELRDPAILETRKRYEEQLRRYVTPHAVTDDEIEGALGAIGLTMEDPHRRLVRAALCHLRDYYEGKVSQKALDAEKNLLVTP
jgi:hypothetical protein